MGVLTELKPMSASAKNNKTDGGRMVNPSSPTAAANINNNIRPIPFECQQQKKSSEGNPSLNLKRQINADNNSSHTTNSLSGDQFYCEYQGDNFKPTEDIVMSGTMKNISPSKTSSLPMPPNVVPFVPTSQLHPHGLPNHNYNPHWNHGPSPGYAPQNIPYSSPPSSMPHPFSNDPNVYRNNMNSPIVHNITPRNGPDVISPPNHINGSTPPHGSTNFAPSPVLGSKPLQLPIGCSSTPPPSPHLSGSWPLPPTSNNPNNLAGANNQHQDQFDPLTKSNVSGDRPSSAMSPNSNKVYGVNICPNAGDEHIERGFPSVCRGNTTSPASHQTSPILCAGCKLRIMDEFVLNTVDKKCFEVGKWHSTCLKCAECGVVLDNHMKCFERDQQLFCKEDFYRMYSHEQDRPRQCSRCLLDIHTTDLVMKAQDCVFHVDCFRCARCDCALKKGDLYGMIDGMPYCQLHHELITSAHSENPIMHPPPHTGGAFSSESLNHSPVDGMPLPSTSVGEHEGFSPQAPMGAGMGYPPYPVHGGPDQQPPPPGWYPGPHGEGPYPPGDYPYENNNTSGMLKKRRGRKKRKVDTAFAASMGGYMDPSMGGYPPHPGMEGQMDHGKSKRARTSFKHHQLRIMRSHFQINQNPDSRELKMLSQKTGLDKKVLQVWFQNSRAKYRRGITQPGAGGSCENNVSASSAGLGNPPSHHSHSSNDATLLSGQEDKGGVAPNTNLNSMINNDETDSDSLMDGMTV